VTEAISKNPTQWDNLRKANTSAQSSSWDTLRQKNERRATQSDASAVAPADADQHTEFNKPVADERVAEQAKFDALLEAERNLGQQSGRAADSIEMR
jgi:hypothetical protein